MRNTKTIHLLHFAYRVRRERIAVEIKKKDYSKASI